jgi:elongation factor 1-gamma
MSGFTLFTDPGNFRAFKVLIAAEYNSVDIAVPTFAVGTNNLTPAFLAKSPLARVPVLDTPQGSIFESGAIARYVARLRADTGLLGASFFDSAQVDAWLGFCSTDIELPATLWYYPFLGVAPFNAALCAKAKADLAKALAVLEAHLLDKTYMVGHAVTLADITLVSALVYPFKFVADAKYRAAFPSVVRWFTTCVNQPQFEAVIGKVVFCEKELAAPAEGAPSAAIDFKKGGGNKEKKEKKEKAPKAPKENKPKEEKKPKVKEVEEEEDEPFVPAAPKVEHPFRIMDKASPSAFSMDTWKKTYSNCGEDYHKAMATFFELYEPAGWTIFRGDYKYNDELKVLFMTANLIGGFIQRTEEIRKWLFGTMTIRGDAGTGMKVTCYYLIRGDSIQPLIDCNDDAACYEWTKVTDITEDFKTTLYDYWCSEGPLDGEVCLDSRVYK